MNRDRLLLFVRSAKTLNISAAGKEMGLSPAVASAYLQKLEAELGVRLLHRTTRKVSLTEDGQVFLPHAENVLASWEAATASVGLGSEMPTGTIRIAAPASFGRMHLRPALTQFLREFPGVQVDLRCTDTLIDLIEGGYDLAIRNSELKDSRLVAKKLASDHRVLCATEAYLQRCGVPKKPDDLKDHECIVLNGMDQWVFKQKNTERRIKVNGRFRTDNGEIVRDACLDGFGISINSLWSIYQDLQSNRLQIVLPNEELVSNTAIWAVYPSSRVLPLKVRYLIDFLTQYFGGSHQSKPYWDVL